MPVKTYRKKPLSVQAIQYKGSQDLSTLSEILDFTDHKFRVRDINEVGNSVITAEVYDELHETWVGVKDGDFILRGLEGEFYPHDGVLMPEAYDEVWA
jgi:hypothetical protein